MERPIGYWVKTVDRLLEDALDASLAAHGVGRRHWQTLNLLAVAPRTGAEVTAELASFLVPGETPLADLEQRGWATATDRHALTATGEEALESLRGAVALVRRRATDGLSEDDYRTTVATLRRMTENLEAPGSGQGLGGVRGTEQDAVHQ